MASDWKETTLGSLIVSGEASLQTGPFGTVLKASEYVRCGVPLISVGEIRYGFLAIRDETPRVGPDTVARLPKYVLHAGDIVFGRKGGVDRNCLISMNEDGWFLGSDGIRLRVSGNVNAAFISHQLRGIPIRQWLLSQAGGTTMASLNEGTLKRIPISLPSLPIQAGIANLLSAFDARLMQLQNQSSTLEAIAKAMFQSWFVDFDPVRSKAEGREPDGMDAATAALFPDSFEATEMGSTPMGWTVQSIGDCSEIVGGSTPSTANTAFWNDGEHYWATPKDLSKNTSPVLLSTERKVTQRGLETISSGLLPIGTVLLSSRAPIGYLAIAEVPVAINQGFIALKAKGAVTNGFLLLWASEAMETIKSLANGSTFQEISKKNFRTIRLVIPDAKVMAAFDQVEKPLFMRITENARMAQILSELRDTLLPRLISGKLRVPEAEKTIGAVL